MVLLNKEQKTALIFLIISFTIGFVLKEVINVSFDEKTVSVNNIISDQGEYSSLISLKLHKKIKVSIQGAVKNPGEYEIRRGTRYFDLIELAGGITDEADESRIKKNYYLKNNDEYYVPYKKSHKYSRYKYDKWIEIEISGAIQSPGKYRVRKGTRYFELIKLAGGLTQNADKKKIRKNYYLKDGQSFYIKPLKFRTKQDYNEEFRTPNSDNKNKFVTKHENIYKTPVRKDKKIEVEIRGAVRKPGVYTMVYGSRFNDLVSISGGYLINARKQYRNNYLLKDGDSYYIPYNKK